MIDLGDTVPLAINVTDVNGNPVNASTVTLTITQPDGSTTTPGTTNPQTGEYTCQFVPTMAGRHQIRWVTTNPATAYTDIFHVETVVSSRWLISLADAREALAKRPGSSTATDDELRFYIQAVTPVIEDIAGTQVLETVVQTSDGGSDAVLLTAPPVSIVSLVENGVALIENTDYFVNYDSGVVYRGTPISPYWFLGGHDNVVVTFTTGGSIVAANVRLAARIILAHLYQRDQQGFRPALGNPATADVVTTPGGFAVPRAAAELLQPAPTALPGFA